MIDGDSRVTIHMATSLDGFIARRDGGVDRLETSDEFADGETMDVAFIKAFSRRSTVTSWDREHTRPRFILRAKGWGGLMATSRPLS
jgi:hypothetical protein